jgi:hypothetical protein
VLLPVVAITPLSARQDEIYNDLGFYVHRLAVKLVWPVTPLPYRIDRRLNQHRMTAYHLQIVDRAFAGDHSLQHNFPCTRACLASAGYFGCTR